MQNRKSQLSPTAFLRYLCPCPKDLGHVMFSKFKLQDGLHSSFTIRFLSGFFRRRSKIPLHLFTDRNQHQQSLHSVSQKPKPVCAVAVKPSRAAFTDEFPTIFGELCRDSDLVLSDKQRSLEIVYISCILSTENSLAKLRILPGNGAEMA